MSHMIGGGQSAQPKPMPTAPALDAAQVAQQQGAAARKQLEAGGGGRASTILTGALGDTGGGSSVSKQLMSLG